MFAALHIPRLALQAALTFSPNSQSQGERVSLGPVVVVDRNAKTPSTLEMTGAAEREGVVVGLSIPQALARCSDLEVRHRCEQSELLVEDLLFDEAYSLSPRIESVSAGLRLVDLRGVTFARALSRCSEIRIEMKKRGIVVRIGLAESSELALLSAKVSKGILVVEAHVPESLGTAGIKQIGRLAFLESLPIDAARPSDKLSGVLEKWGIRTVRAFAAIERGSVGAKLGVEGLALWDQVNGRTERTISVVDLPLSFEQSWEFEYDVDSLDPLLFLLRRFLDNLCLKMRTANKVAKVISVELRLAYGEPIEISQKLPEPSCDVEALYRLMSARIEDAEPDSPVVKISLSIEVIDFKQRQFGLFESSLKNSYRFAQTLARVAGIIGAERLGRPELQADGRPDGFVMKDLPASVPPVSEERLNACHEMTLRRFRPRKKAVVEIQGRLPIWFRSESTSGFVKTQNGPWMNSGHWWESQDNWSRVEWDVELNKGGLYRLVKDSGGWFLEGEYD